VSSDSAASDLVGQVFTLIANRLNGLSILVGAVLFITLVGGCGKSDAPVRVPVTGTVTLDESPLLIGLIRFVPTDEKGGPAASARIVGGEFEFSAADGPVIANHRVEIEATDYQDFSIDDEAAFAAEVERTGASPVATNPVPAIYSMFHHCQANGRPSMILTTCRWRLLPHGKGTNWL